MSKNSVNRRTGNRSKTQERKRSKNGLNQEKTSGL